MSKPAFNPRSRRGPTTLKPSERRDKRLSVWLTAEELEYLDQLRSSVSPTLQRAEYIRGAIFKNLPASVPIENIIAWDSLGRIGANLNQIAKWLNTSAGLVFDRDLLLPQLEELRDLLKQVRAGLLGRTAGGEP